MILDVGCGPGTQTMDVASVSRGCIVAMDIHQPYLDELRHRIVTAGAPNRVRLLRASMFDIPFGDDVLDVIWAEGSIYIIGFERGLAVWRRFLKSGGHVAATHLSWLMPEVPREPREFWAQHYPAMATVTENLEIARRCGFEVVDHFTLPESAWWTDYYDPMEKRLARLEEQHGRDRDAIALLESTQEQIDLYRRFADCYGYVFYILRKR
jgi:ubiquinone/menaquinone biosynthesis C-methylase UbiE